MTTLQNAIDLLGRLLVALSPVLPLVVPFLLPAIFRHVKRFQVGDGPAAAEAISRAGLIGSTRFAQVLQEQLAKATSPDSPGGMEVTKEERLAASLLAGKAAIDAVPPETLVKTVELLTDEAMERMAKAGELRNAVKAYDGDESLVRESVRLKILAKTGVGEIAPGASVTTQV